MKKMGMKNGREPHLPRSVRFCIDPHIEPLKLVLNFVHMSKCA